MVSDLTEANIETVGEWLLQHGRSAELVRSLRICLLAIARQAVEDGYRIDDAHLELPKHPPLSKGKAVAMWDVTLRQIVTAAVRHGLGEPLGQIAADVTVGKRTLY